MEIIKKILKNFKYENNIGLLNVTDEFFALYIKKIFNEEQKGILVVTPTLFEANKLNNIVLNYMDTLVFQIDDFMINEAIATSPELKVERLNVLNELINDNKRVVFTDINGYLKKLPNTSDYKEQILELRVGLNIKHSELIDKLYDLGYIKESLVTNIGEIGIRGFVVDIFSVNEEYPVRIEFFGDEIESIRYFDSDTQKSINETEKIEIYPFSFINNNDSNSLYDYMKNPIVIFKDYEQLMISYKRLVEDNFFYSSNDTDAFYDFEYIKPNEKMYWLDFDNEISILNKKNYIDFKTKKVEKFNEDLNKIKKYLVSMIENNKTIIISLSTVNVNKFIKELDIDAVITNESNIFLNKINIIKKAIHYGFIYEDFIFLTEYEMFNKTNILKTKKSRYKFASKIKDFTSINSGDYVVHNTHGIGVYNGIKTISKNGFLNDYLEILYAKGDKLYIPASKLELLSKYSSKEGYVPRINTLNSTAWQKTKQNIREKLKYEASRLLKIQAEREMKKGFAFSNDTPMQTMFESEFLYDETPDQIKVINEIKKDMENNAPMDRILCGDVGYGKTEVAFRAMFKAVIDSKQVIYICPTTLLSRQQYESATERFINFPVNIEILNRFTTLRDTKRILNNLSNGKIDILIGTHRLLSSDIKPSDLGLLIIDEEQRFGVAHKEKIKEYKSNIDVLSLTATPIPRTLQMVMLGIKGLSLVETPPKNRHAVQTYVTPYNDKLVRDIIYKEMSRNGQAFILHNNIDDIENKKYQIEKLVPDAKIIYAHGQMPKKELENRINDFISGKYDVLLCTTIIETGIDIPNVNSLIILNADYFGLSQLYQIRGRVGRSDRIAYAYLMYDNIKILSEIAIKRLQTIKEFTELGSGLSIAARDLSIRGAGDILGSEQAGFIDSVGIDLYMKMLNDEISKLKGIEIEEEVLDNNSSLIEISNHIDNKYIEDESLKIEIHKIINSVKSIDNLIEIKDILEDRFGKINNDLNIYLHEELFEKLLKKQGVIKVNDNNIFIELIFSKEKSESIDYQNVFMKAINIDKDLIFDYKKKMLHIKLVKKKLNKHYLEIINELLEKM